MMEHYFEELMTWILKQESADLDAEATATALAQAVANLPNENYYYNARSALQSILPVLLSRFAGIAWPLIGAAIVSTDKIYHFSYLMGGEIQPDHGIKSPLLDLPENTLFAWCHDHPDRAPAFAARVIPLLKSDGQDSSLCVHPVMVQLLEAFGDRQDVIQAIDDNMCTGSYWGPQAAFFERNLEPVKRLLEHPNNNVRRWAKVTLRRIQARVDRARIDDAESEARCWS